MSVLVFFPLHSIPESNEWVVVGEGRGGEEEVVVFTSLSQQCHEHGTSIAG